MKFIQIAILISYLACLSGCSGNSVMLTFYGKCNSGSGSFANDLKQCENGLALSKGADFEANRPGNDDYDYETSLFINSCLVNNGWIPEIQFIAETEAASSDLISSIISCVASNQENRQAGDKESFCGNSAARKVLTSCLSSLKGRTVSAPPWLNTDASGDLSIPLANYPVLLAYEADNSQDINGIVFRDRNMALSWSIPEGSFLSWESAVAKIRDINRGGYAGKDDWRIPSREELEGFLTSRKQETVKQFIAGNGVSTRLDGLFWTDSYPVDNSSRRFVLDFNSGVFTVLDTSGPFVCRLMVVRGKGWQILR
jgi:hypothetical protein